MTPKTYPLFSEYQSLRRTNPNAYWSTRTQTEMAQAYKQHGPAFFDIRKAKT